MFDIISLVRSSACPEIKYHISSFGHLQFSHDQGTRSLSPGGKAELFLKGAAGTEIHELRWGFRPQGERVGRTWVRGEENWARRALIPFATIGLTDGHGVEEGRNGFGADAMLGCAFETVDPYSTRPESFAVMTVATAGELANRISRAPLILQPHQWAKFLDPLYVTTEYAVPLNEQGPLWF